jgi:hypothetical protein
MVEHGRSAVDVAGWMSGFDWGRVDERIQVLGRWVSQPTNVSVRRPGKLAFEWTDALHEAFAYFK